MPRPKSNAPVVLQNRFFHLEVFENAGPRISGLIPTVNSQNLLSELENEQWETPNGVYRLHGGHRLWAAPEIPAVTYFPDDQGVRMEILSDGVRLSRQDIGGVYFERSIEIHLEPDAPRAHLRHDLRNLGSSPLTVAPWAITMLPMGSRVLVPLANDIVDDNPFLPNRNFILWPYADPADPRFTLQHGSITLTSDPQRSAFKFGVYSTRGWAAAQVGSWLLVKRFTPHPVSSELDLGANLEVYTNQRFMELETLGELRTLMGGESVEHEEIWDVLPGKLEDLDANGMLRASSEGK